MHYRFLRFPGGRTKAVTLSYDDGRRSDIRLVETLNRYQMKCTFNLSSTWLHEAFRQTHLTKDEVMKFFIDAGHEIAIHGAEHKAPSRTSAIEGIRDVLECRMALERMFGRIIRGYAYPDCGITQIENTGKLDGVKRYLTDMDIVYARTLGRDNARFALPHDWLEWMPTAHHTNPEILDYAERFMTLNVAAQYEANRTPKLFYLWGHSFEFEAQDNWSLLDALCERLGESSAVWYATNMELYEYVKAYDALQFSADGSLVKNPTCLDIWFEFDEETYHVGACQILRLRNDWGTPY